MLHQPYTKNNFELLTLLFIIFVFTKIYEGIVTVEGEDFVSKMELKSYYDLGYDALEFQLCAFDYLINHYAMINKDRSVFIIEKYIGDGSYDESNKKIVEMLKKMKNSIFDHETGSIDKTNINGNNKFMRKYPPI